MIPHNRRYRVLTDLIARWVVYALPPPVPRRVLVSRRTKWILGSAAAAVVVIGFGTWWAFFRDTAPPPVAIEDAVAVIEGPPDEDPGAETTTSTTTTTIPGLDGSWTVEPQLGSFVGYRVQEELAGIGAKTAVGRTQDLDGSLNLEGSTITEVEISADLTGLESDDSRRDGAIRTRGLETDTFPTAVFSLTEPIELESEPAEGASVSATALGDLTIHGVTQSVEVAIEAQLAGGVIVVVGSVPINMFDYDITPPVGFSVLSIDEDGEMEFQLFFARS
jgi:polyisoprenoid-binding protein YceI